MHIYIYILKRCIYIYILKGELRSCFPGAELFHVTFQGQILNMNKFTNKSLHN